MPPVAVAAGSIEGETQTGQRTALRVAGHRESYKSAHSLRYSVIFFPSKCYGLVRTLRRESIRPLCALFVYRSYGTRSSFHIDRYFIQALSWAFCLATNLFPCVQCLSVVHHHIICSSKADRPVQPPAPLGTDQQSIIIRCA